ncbi:alpha/beta fold hydrolase [Novosphingobium sp. BL-8A]|uniref:alpha/beta hydrolase n=1 Tax=Novosphingobium sp. BL-8A TaxID=3127639 RepID=UPI0037569D40
MKILGTMKILAAATLTTLFGAAGQSAAAEPAPLIIREQGSFAIGGTVQSTPGTFVNNAPTAQGQSFHGDHLYAFYQVPVKPRPLPIVMLHGAYQSGRSWETTPDGREGFQTLFLRRGFSTYVVDQPRRGRAGNSSVATTIEPTPNDQLFFDQFRLGAWPRFFPGVQFDQKPEALDQFFRSITPNTGPYDAKVISSAMTALLEKTGPAILFTHSQGGEPGWLTAIRSANVKAVVAFEPGSGFVFPKGEAPAEMPSAAGTLKPVEISGGDFAKLTRIPIVIYYGDNIPIEPTTERGKDNWRVRLAMAKLWVAAVNRHGGDARLVHLPDIGIRGNTHFMMSDLNNRQIADQVSQFLAEKHLDPSETPKDDPRHSPRQQTPVPRNLRACSHVRLDRSTLHERSFSGTHVQNLRLPEQSLYAGL